MMDPINIGSSGKGDFDAFYGVITAWGFQGGDNGAFWEYEHGGR